MGGHSCESNPGRRQNTDALPRVSAKFVSKPYSAELEGPRKLSRIRLDIFDFEPHSDLKRSQTQPRIPGTVSTDRLKTIPNDSWADFGVFRRQSVFFKLRGSSVGHMLKSNGPAQSINSKIKLHNVTQSCFRAVNQASGTDFGRTATGKAWPAFCPPEGRFRRSPGSSPSEIRPGRPLSGPETLLRNIEHLRNKEAERQIVRTTSSRSPNTKRMSVISSLLLSAMVTGPLTEQALVRRALWGRALAEF